MREWRLQGFFGRDSKAGLSMDGQRIDKIDIVIQANEWRPKVE